MSSDERRSSIHRRDFLFRTSSGIALGVAATLGTATGAEAKDEGAQAAAQAGYRETEHVRKAYALARF